MIRCHPSIDDLLNAMRMQSFRSCMKILIIRVSAIGDVVHTLPAAYLLKTLIPTCSLHWVVQKKAASLLERHPLFEKVWVLPDHYLAPRNLSSTLRVVRQLRRMPWDAIIDFQGILKTTLVLMLLRGKKFGFDKKFARSSWTTLATHVHHSPDVTHIVQKNLSLASCVSQYLINYQVCPTVEGLKANFSVYCDQRQQDEVNTWFSCAGLLGKNLIFLVPNTTWPEKHWPHERWVNLIKLLYEHKDSRNILPVLVGVHHGKAARSVYETCQTQAIPPIVLPAWDLSTCAYALTKARLVVAPDTGILHLADFLSVQTIALFGPTNAETHGPFWEQTNRESVVQKRFYKIESSADKKQKTVSCLQSMYTLQPIDLFSRINIFLGRETDDKKN